MKYISFNNNWRFWESTNSFALSWAPPENARVLNLPHDAMIEISQDPNSKSGKNTGYRRGGVFCYSKSFCADAPDKTYILKVDGAYMNAFVYVNGQLAAKRPNGYTVFYVPLNDYLDFGQDNEIRIQVRSGSEPNSRWYSGTGLYRDVYLLEAGMQYIKPDSVKIKTLRIPEKPDSMMISSEDSTDIKNSLTGKKNDDIAADIQVSAVIASRIKEIAGSLEIVIRDEKEQRVAGALITLNNSTCDQSSVSQAYSIPTMRFENARPAYTDDYSVETVISVPHPCLWDINTPNLYTCTLLLKSVSGTVLDSHTDSFGIRSIFVNSKEGLLVNGTSVKLRGACIHHDSGILGTKTYEDAHIRQIRILKEAGFNAIRSAHNPAAPALLNACDKVGMFVMDEAFDMWTRHKSDYDYGMFFEEWWEADIEAMVCNAFNHPSVIMYSIGNEIPEIATAQGERIAQMICDKIKFIDDSRFTLASVNGIFSAGDALGQIVEDIAPEQKELAGSNRNVNEFMAVMHEYLDEITIHPIMDTVISVPFKYTDIAGYNYMGNRYDMDGSLHPERVIVGSETGIRDLCFNWSRVKRLSNVIGEFCWTGWEYLGESGIGAVYYLNNNPLENGEFPAQIAGTGCIDITGKRLPMSYYSEIVFGLRKDPYIAVQDPAHYSDKIIIGNPWTISNAIGSWSFDEYIGKPVIIEVYSNAEEVELFKNGISLGRKQAGETVGFRVFFETIIEPGSLIAVSYIADTESGRYEISSAGEKLHLSITEEPGDHYEICFLNIEIVDEKGILAYGHDTELCLTVEGTAQVLGFGSADPKPLHNYTENIAKTWQGRAQLILKTDSFGAPTKISVVSNSGLSCSITI